MKPPVRSGAVCRLSGWVTLSLRPSSSNRLKRETTGLAVGPGVLTKSRGTKPEDVPIMTAGGVLVVVVVTTVEIVVTLVFIVALGVTMTVELLVSVTWVVLVVLEKE
jgi:hypothetical protein